MKPGRSRTPRGKSDEFWTPRDIIEAMAGLNGAPYAVDFAANARNAVASCWFGNDPSQTLVRRDALGTQWAEWIQLAGPGWCNPPYSKPNLPLFTAKALEAAPRLRYPLDLLVPVSFRASWWRPLWTGRIVDNFDRATGPLRGEVLQFRCKGYSKEIIFLGYSVRFLGDGKPADGALGSHAIIRLGPVPFSR